MFLFLGTHGAKYFLDLNLLLFGTIHESGKIQGLRDYWSLVIAKSSSKGTVMCIREVITSTLRTCYHRRPSPPLPGTRLFLTSARRWESNLWRPKNLADLIKPAQVLLPPHPTRMRNLVDWRGGGVFRRLALGIPPTQVTQGVTSCRGQSRAKPWPGTRRADKAKLSVQRRNSFEYVSWVYPSGCNSSSRHRKRKPAMQNN